MDGEMGVISGSVNRDLHLWSPYAHRRQRRKMGPRLYLPVGEPPAARWRVRMSWVNPAYEDAVHTEDFRRWFPECAAWCDGRGIRIDTARHNVEGAYVSAFCDSFQAAADVTAAWKDRLSRYSSAFSERSMVGTRFRTSRVGTREMAHAEDDIRAIFPHRVEILGHIDLGYLDSQIRAPYYLGHRRVSGTMMNQIPTTAPLLFFLDHRDAVLARLMDDT